MSTTQPRRVLSTREVLKKVPLSRTQLWRKSRDLDDEFPAPIELGPNSTGYFEDEIDDWLASRPRRGASLRNADAPPNDQQEAPPNDQHDEAPP